MSESTYLKEARAKEGWPLSGRLRGLNLILLAMGEGRGAFVQHGRRVRCVFWNDLSDCCE